MPDIPKKLHAVWLGSIVPEEARENVQAWSVANPDYQMNLWIDSSLYPQEPRAPKMALTHRTEDKESFAIERKKYQTAVADYEDFKNKYHEFLLWATKNKIAIRDIGKPQKKGGGYNYKEKGLKHECFHDDTKTYNSMLNKRYYDDEVLGTGRNFAAASDILRAEALFHEGGIYFDISDVFPGSLALGRQPPPLGFYCNCVLASGIALVSINNDFLGTVANGEIIEKYRQGIQKQYQDYYAAEEQKVLRKKALRTLVIQKF